MSPLASRSRRAEEDLGVLGEGNPGKSQTVATRDDPKKRLVSRRQKADESFMSTVMEIEKAIEELPSRDMQKLFSWVEEKQAMLDLLQLNDASLTNFEHIKRLDAFFFAVLEVLHNRYKKDNSYLDALWGQSADAAPSWDNFNEHQTEQHSIQLNEV